MSIIKRVTLFTVVCALILTFGATVMAADIYDSYTVKPGDTVYKIAQAKGLRAEAIVNANGLDNGGQDIYPNMVLVLDSNAKNSPQANYTVSSGDSLYKIAVSYGTTVKELQRVNSLTAARIYAGQRLYIPQAVAPEVENSGNTLDLTEDEIYMMAKMIYGEARGESYSGQVAVGAVIINRIKSPDFPNTMAGVLFQKNQFSAVDDGQYYLTPDSTAIAAAYDAAAGTDP
ncbi:MAG: LysM peptidoglycan-binding domain-containing protein, partial [Bacillota bacterium]|nr:LysM peptidoglycan-binding domain-containing protein [Bacillota bacterium]